MKRNLLVFCLAPVMLVAGGPGSSTDGKLKVAATPSKAGVFLDDTYMGPAFLKYPLPAGKYQITLSDPRFDVAAVPITIDPGKTLSPAATLTPKAEPKGPFGTIRVVGPSKYAGVFLNDEYVGYVGEFNGWCRGLQVNPGTYDLLIEAPGGDGMLAEKVTVEADKTLVVQQAMATTP